MVQPFKGAYVILLCNVNAILSIIKYPIIKYLTSL